MHIDQYQKLMKQLYYDKDKSRGLSNTFIWFIEEVGELASLIKTNRDELELDKISSELADIFAWLCSLANLFGVNLEHAALAKYPHVCSKCKQNPCICKNII